MEQGQTILERIDEAANMWNKTRNPKYKEHWYKLIVLFFSFMSYI